jgi:hypothetical protein
MLLLIVVAARWLNSEESSFTVNLKMYFYKNSEPTALVATSTIRYQVDVWTSRIIVVMMRVSNGYTERGLGKGNSENLKLVPPGQITSF